MKWGYIPRLRLFMVTLRKANVCALRFHETLRQEHNSFGLHDPSWCDGRDDGCRGLATDREVFETYVERVLAPTLECRQVVIMDNLLAHKPAKVRELIEERGCELVYLPSYSPDFNPIEEAFSKIKGMVRQAGARTREALVEVLGEALSA